MKTITLDTAKSLKAAFDAAGIEMPETEQFWVYGTNDFIDDHHYWKLGDGAEAMYYDQNPVDGNLVFPAPNAEELGKWLPNYFLRMPLSMSRFEDGTYFYRYSAVNNGSWNQVPKITKGHEWQCEAWAHLLIACLKADLEQIKKHLENLKWIQLFHF